MLDEHVPGAVITAAQALEPVIDIVRMQDVGLRTRPDAALVTWATANDRLIVTHDAKTLIGEVYRRLVAGTPFPGVVAYSNKSSIGKLAEDIVLVAVMHTPEQTENQVFYSPL